METIESVDLSKSTVNHDAAITEEKYNQLLHKLKQGLPEHCILTRIEQRKPYECDGLTLFKVVPAIVVLPETETQIIHIAKTCHQLNVPLVPRGAGTGLSGGATPHHAGILIGLSKLNQIKKIDVATATAIVQPGVRNLAVSEAAAPYALYYAPDPSSQIACSIGGNIAENAGGVHCLKYGLTLHNVLKVRVVTIEGEIVELGSQAPDSPGLNLLPLFIGSEGMMGIATEVTVRLTPKPALARVIMASFPTVESAGQAVTDIIAAGFIPAGLEMMDKRATQLVEPFVNAGYDLEAEAILLCESDGIEAEVEDEIAGMTAVFNKAGANKVQVSQSEAERLLFWAGRKNAFPAAGRASPDYICMDGTIPRNQLGKVLNAMVDMEKRYQLRCANVFHAGDGNLHPLILFNGNDPDELHRAEEFGAEILELCIAVGGTVTGEHGVGLEKINQMCTQFTRHELDAFTAVKTAFDPQRLLNPLKQIPSLNRCAEYGKMHVHQGELKFSELERF